ncbi:MAG: hypothetical protein EBR51_10310, partial [Gammaproteobacteria bacterium]|nr:hypothetical protein [Gammaproteobacteria bacterium]
MTRGVLSVRMTKSFESVVPMKLIAGSVPKLPVSDHAVVATVLPMTAPMLAWASLPSEFASTMRSKFVGRVALGSVPASPGNSTSPPARPIVTAPEVLPLPIATVAPLSVPSATLPLVLSDALASVVNTPVLGVRLPIGVPLIEPPLIVALPLVSVAAVKEFAVTAPKLLAPA